MTTLNLPNDPRAEELLGEMDARFFETVNGLSEPLRARAHMRGTYDGTDSPDPFEGPASMNPGLTCTPWMFWEITSGLDDQQFVELSMGGGLVILASTLLDHLADRQVENVGETALLQSTLHGLGVSTLRQAIGQDPEFWSHAERLLSEHRGGLTQEIQWRLEPDLLQQEHFVEAVSAKFAPIALTMTACLSAAGRQDLIEPVERSIKHLAVASQLLDDLGDWEDDLQNRRLTLFIKSLAPELDWTAEEWPAVEELQQQIDANWSETELLNWAKEWLDRSQEAVSDFECQAWNAYLDGFRELTDQHLEARTARHLARSIEELLPD